MTQMTTHHRMGDSNVNGEYNKEQPQMAGPLILNQVASNKRHTSVEPNSGEGNRMAMALIPNGTNNGKVYRRQSTDHHQALQVLTHMSNSQAAGMNMVQLNELNSGALTRQDKANAWVRRMRFVMSQATSQNQLGGQLQTPSIAENTQLVNGATIHQVISQLQEKSQHNLISPVIGESHYQGKNTQQNFNSNNFGAKNNHS